MMNRLTILASFMIAGSFFACSRTHVLQPSVSVQAYRMDEEIKNIFVDTNPLGASFSVIPGPCVNNKCTAFAKFHGFTGRKKYLLFCPNTADTQNPIAMHSITLDDSCVIEEQNGTEIKRNSFEFQTGAFPGFQSTWYLWAEDDSIRLAQKATPKPLQAIGADGAKLTVIRKETGGNFVDVVASGLQPDEQVCFVFRSLDEQFYYPGKAPENGRLHMPFVASFVGINHGVMAGKSFILLIRENETLEIEHDWDLSTTLAIAKKN